MQLRNGIGLFAGVFLVLSSAAHGLLGWPAMLAELSKTTAPAALISGLHVGWIFGSVCMVIFGIVLVRLFLRRMRGLLDDTTPARLVGAGYLAFGVWAMSTAGADPFYVVFLAPGALLFYAASGSAKT